MKRVACLIIVSVALALPRVSAAVPGRVQREGVSVTVQVVGADETKDIFDVDLLARGIQPLVIEIHNESPRSYQFTKANIDARYLPAAEAAKAAYENPILIGGHVLGRVLGVIPRVVLPLKSRKKVPPRPVLNRSIRASFEREEIPDGEITPSGSLKGFMYIRPLEPGVTLRVTLIDAQTHTPLVFNIPH